MARPVIMSVDDDPQVLGAIERDLRQHYKADYRVLKAGSAHEALDAARQLKQRGTPVALFLVDQRMPEMTGTKLLAEVKELHPDSRKVLLTAYADTGAAIESINDVGLDHYLMKPWDPPEQKLYPVLDDLLAEWKVRAHLPYDGIRIAGARFSQQSYTVRDFLSRNQVPYQWIDIDEDASMKKLVSEYPGGLAKLPIVLFPDGTYLSNPSNLDLAQKVGIQTKAQRDFYDVIVVGSGPAGLGSGVYAASEGLRTLLIERSAPGGQAGTSARIENYLGFPSGITGADLAQRATAQARRFGAELLTAQEAVSFRREDPYRFVKLSDGTELSCYVIMIATGMSVRKLEAPGIEELLGKGVFYGAAMTEAATYRGQDVCVVGGANSAGQGALYFSRYAKSVTMLVRAKSLEASMSQYLVDRIHAAPNMRVIHGVEVASATGKDRLEEVTIRNCDNREVTALKMAAMFIFIGAAPHSEMIEGFALRDEKGFILTGPDLPKVGNKPKGWTLARDPFLFETNVPGVFAVGDVRSGANQRVASAVGEGAAGIYMVHRYLQTV